MLIGHISQIPNTFSFYWNVSDKVVNKWPLCLQNQNRWDLDNQAFWECWNLTSSEYLITCRYHIPFFSMGNHKGACKGPHHSGQWAEVPFLSLSIFPSFFLLICLFVFAYRKRLNMLQALYYKLIEIIYNFSPHLFTYGSQWERCMVITKNHERTTATTKTGRTCHLRVGKEETGV